MIWQLYKQDSTISHVGFILLALGISSVESTQAFIFYLTQYTISNLNAFFILVAIGFSLYGYNSENKEHGELMDKTNSPVQLVNQLKGYFYINPALALSLAITIFSFIGIPPLIGFFGKQMVLSAAMDKGLIFLSLIAILTSVIGAVYYLSIVKEMFFSLPDHKINTLLKNLVLKGTISKRVVSRYIPDLVVHELERVHEELRSGKRNVENLTSYFNYKNIVISSFISFVISCITLQILLFLFFNKEWLSMGKNKSKSYLKKISLNNKIVNGKPMVFVNNYTTNTKLRLDNNKIRRKLSLICYRRGILPPDAEGSFMIHLENNKEGLRMKNKTFRSN